MKERGILFSAPMVRALLAGTKTQTRRALRVQPDDDYSLVCEWFHPTVVDRHGEEQPGAEIFGATSTDGDFGLRCPYGAPGDRLWVRETWGFHVQAQSAARDEDGPFVYAADQSALQYRLGSKWTPAIHMFRWASRITLEITGVRVERLQDISEADAIAEGTAYPAAFHGPDTPYRTAYGRLWDAINGPGSWDANPLVWVVEFKKESSNASA